MFAVLHKPHHHPAVQAAAGSTAIQSIGQEEPNTSDGLYRAPETSLALDDAAFFGEALLRGRRKRRRDGNAEATAGDGTSDAWCGRVISRKELAALQHGGVEKRQRNPNAGNTPNCPFDCDCCF